MKIKFIAAGAAFCALGMTGCSNETNEPDAQTGKQVVMTMQTATDVPQTRADYTEDETDETKMNFSWRNGDAVGVAVDGITDSNYELTTSEAGKSASFTGTVTPFSDTKTIYAIYPYSTTQYSVNKPQGKVTLTLPNPQKYTIGGPISNSFMIGVGTATATDKGITASASLKQVMSIIKLKIKNAPSKVTGVKLKCAEAVFTTAVTVSFSDVTISQSIPPTGELSMDVTDNSTNNATDKEISFAIFPTEKADGKEIQIEVTYDNGTTKSVTKKGVDFARNMHYVMDFDGTPAATNYIEIGNFQWAVGNLVADGPNGCKIGAPTDGGLYFQFGSLVGWSGGTTGDGTGKVDRDLASTLKVKPAAFEGKEDWTDTGKTWPNKTKVPFTTKGSNSNEEKAGIGDPCRYYLGGTWRLPENSEYGTANLLAGSAEYPSAGPWTWNPSSMFAIHSSGLTFPGSGYRSFDKSELSGIGYGYYWSATPAAEGKNGLDFFFDQNSIKAGEQGPLRSGFPVRCVRNKVTN